MKSAAPLDERNMRYHRWSLLVGHTHREVYATVSRKHSSEKCSVSLIWFYPSHMASIPAGRRESLSLERMRALNSMTEQFFKPTQPLRH